MDVDWNRQPKNDEEDGVCVNICFQVLEAAFVHKDKQIENQLDGPRDKLNALMEVLSSVMLGLRDLPAGDVLFLRKATLPIEKYPRHNRSWAYIEAMVYVLRQLGYVEITDGTDEGVYALVDPAPTVIKATAAPTASHVAPQTASIADQLKGDTGLYSVKLKLDLSLSDLFNPFVEALTRTIIDNMGTRVRNDTIQGTAKALSVLLANLLRANQINPDLWVAVPLGSGKYPRGPFNPSGVGYRAIDRVVDYLHSREYCTFKPGVYFPESDTRYFSRIRSNSKLIDMISHHLDSHRQTYCITSNASLSQSVANTELFKKGDLPVIRLKSVERKLIPDFEMTPAVASMQDELRNWNEFQRLHWVDLLLPDSEFAEVASGRSEDPDLFDEFGDKDELAQGPVDLLFQRNLYRLFNNGSFHQGGRLYGGWWQSIPSGYRRYITINWVPTCELGCGLIKPHPQSHGGEFCESQIS